MNKLKNSLGFSLIEMALSTFMVISISVVAYRVLKTQTEQQVSSIENQRSNRSAQIALDRFKSDVKRFDPNWVRYGIAAVYPHQGYGYADNYYLMSSTSQAKIELNDGITFLRRSVDQDRLYVPTGTAERLCYPSILLDGDLPIYNTVIEIDSTSNLAIGDWMMAWQAGNYILGIISDVGELQTTTSVSSRTTTSSDNAGENKKFIRLRALNSIEKQVTRANSKGKSTGFVTKHGVVPASFDISGSETSDTSDDSYCFETSKVNFQKIASPVSYFVDYQTSNGEAKKANNTYTLDPKSGEKIKMLVRSEYVNGLEKRQYLAPIDEVAFFYDLMEDGLVARDVGREQTAEGLLNISVANPSQATSNFLSSFKIVAVKLLVNSKVKNENMQEWTQSSNVKVAFDPSAQQDIYQDKMNVASAVTGNLNTLPKVALGAVNETLGKPLYLVTGDAHEVIVPVSTVEVMGDGSMGNNSKGALYVYNSEGCAVNSSGSCDPSNGSVVTFNPGAGKIFFPSSVTQQTDQNGSRKLLIGGVTMYNNEGHPERFPGLAVITLGQNERIEDKLDNPSNGDCNISNCTWHSFSRGAGTEELVDTANIAINAADPNKFYIAPMTKQTGKDSLSAVFKAQLSATGFEVTRFANIPRTDDGKIVTAISNKTLRINGVDYLAVCLSKNMSDSCGGECISNTETGSAEIKPGNVNNEVSVDDRGDEDTKPTLTDDQMYGEIQLVREGATSTIPLIKHNYMCSALSVDDNQNLIASGRLSMQPIAFNAIKNSVLASRSINKLLYLDEAIAVSGATTRYADYFKVDPSTYESGESMIIGWMTGTSAVEFPDGTFGMVNANKYRLAPGYSGNTSDFIKEYSNAGISRLSLSGMGDRVVATIETDTQNINNSIITASYTPRTSELPSIYIPGTFLTKGGHARTSPTPLPSIPPSLSEISWFNLYQSMLTSKGDAGLNSGMPVLDENYTEVTTCQNTRPQTCE